MQRKIETITISLEKTVIEGWEANYDELNVEVLRIALQQGHSLPRIDVVRKGEKYQLAFGKRTMEDFTNYGGHSRAIAHWKERMPIECNVLTRHRKSPKRFSINYIPIQEIPPEKDFSHDARFRLGSNLAFLPEKIRQEFMRSHDLFFVEGYLITGENYRNPPPF